MTTGVEAKAEWRGGFMLLLTEGGNDERRRGGKDRIIQVDHRGNGERDIPRTKEKKEEEKKEEEKSKLVNENVAFVSFGDQTLRKQLRGMTDENKEQKGVSFASDGRGDDDADECSGISVRESS